MPNDFSGNHCHPNLRKVAREAMIDHGFLVDVPPEAERELASHTEPSFQTPGTRDLSSLLWSSIDNDESKDLDQVAFARREATGTRVYVGIADVDSFVHQDSEI